MSIFKGIKTKNALTRLQEEQLYEYIANEMETGQIRKGLMAKAVAESNGNESRVNSIYIKLRLQSLIDEGMVLQAISAIANHTSLPQAITNSSSRTVKKEDDKDFAKELELQNPTNALSKLNRTGYGKKR